jgi:hypothetical protein
MSKHFCLGDVIVVIVKQGRCKADGTALFCTSATTSAANRLYVLEVCEISL